MSLLTQNDIYKHEIVISLSMVKPRSKRKLKMFLKLILDKLLFDIQSLLYCLNLFKKNSKQISQSFILCILIRTITCTTMKVFSQKGRACFLVFVTDSTINLSGLAYIECKRLMICCFVFFTYYDSK